jgi:hypothetical protein
LTAERRNLALLAGAWAVVGVIMTVLSWHAIMQRQFPDPDDIMRLAEVRDWIAGQSWFDVTQYRLNSPAGGGMHWSRLVDVPIGAVIVAVQPLLGQDAGETAALIVVPLITLGIAMLLVERLGSKLTDRGPALAAAIATPLSIGALKQMRPLRIDHHGWQIVLALLATLAAMDERPRRSGIVAGAALALWLNISIEGLPFAAAFGALFAWQWLVDRSASKRLTSYLGSLTVSSLLLFILTHAPSAWMSQPGDVVTPAHLAAFVVAWLGCSLAARLGPAQLGARVASLALVGGLTVGTMFAIDPQWVQGPFGSLDPLVRRLWYDHVHEGLPAWKLPWNEWAILVAQPLVGVIGGAVAFVRSSGGSRRLWAIYLFVLFAMTFEGLFVIRTETTASVLAMPATAYLCQLALRRAQRLSLLPARVVATAGALFIMAPAYAVPLTVAKENKGFERVADAGNECVAKDQLDALRQLPTGEIAAPLDITPAILMETEHHAIATGHHRNAGGMHDVIALFLYPPAEGAKILVRRHSDYLVFCPGGPEALRYAYYGRDGLAAQLVAGKAPDWLEPVSLPGLRGLKVWRVRKDLLSAGRV